MGPLGHLLGASWRPREKRKADSQKAVAATVCAPLFAAFVWWSNGKSLAFSVVWWSRGNALAFPLVWWCDGKSLVFSRSLVVSRQSSQVLLGVLLGVFFGPLGGLLGPFLGPLGGLWASWAAPGPSGAVPGPLLGASWTALGGSWPAVGSILGRSWAAPRLSWPALGASWASLGASWAALGSEEQIFAKTLIRPVFYGSDLASRGLKLVLNSPKLAQICAKRPREEPGKQENTARATREATHRQQAPP